MSARPPFPLGVYYEMPNAEYQASPGVSHTGLTDFAQSPFHFFARHLDPNRPARETKAGQLEGSLTHCAALEPEHFDARYPVGPALNRNTKAWKEFAEQHPGRDCIQPDQRTAAFAQAKSVRAKLGGLMDTGRAEVSAFWIDPITGELCRCRPDWVHPIGDGVILVDLKTYSDASPREFARQVLRKGYHRQAAHYTDGFSIASGLPVVGFVFAAVETTWPYAASAVMLDDDYLQAGRLLNRDLLNRYSECRAANHWPAYGDSIEEIEMPRRAA